MTLHVRYEIASTAGMQFATASDAVKVDLPYTSIQRSAHIHPTVSELIPTVFGDLQAVD